MSIADAWFSDVSDEPVISGVVTGIVSDVVDDTGRGRIKVTLPTLGDNVETGWAPVATFWAGEKHGAFFLPKKDDEVLVVFDRGNLSRPYIIGSVYNGKDLPVVEKEQQQDVMEIKTLAGNIVRLDDTKDGEKIQFIDKNQNVISIESNGDKININSKGLVSINAVKGDVTVNSEEGNLSITAKKGNVSIEAALGTITLKSKEINLEAPTINVKGTQVNLGGV